MRTILMIILLAGTGVLSAQQPTGQGKITGKIIDSAGKQPLEYATITVFAAGNSKPVNGTASTATGQFTITGMAPGTYKLLIESIGYATHTISSVTVKGSNVNVGSIALFKKEEKLQDVTVVSRKALVETKIDKMIFNAEKDITSQTGVATDVLKKVPQVTVDVDGNVELQGNSNIRFLIDGKPSSIFGNNITDALQSIPASSIKSIEVVTSPGAKYDAEGTGGVINIILKKSNIRGINGNIAVSAGTRLENGSLNLNMRHGNFGMNAFFNGNAQLLSTTNNSLNRTSWDSSNRITHLLQDGSGDFKRSGYETGIGFDWSITPKDNISGSFGYDKFGTRSTGFTNQQIFTDSLGTQLSNNYSTRYSDNNIHNNSIDWSLNYKRKFNKGRELEILYNASYGSSNSYYTQTQNVKPTGDLFAGTNGNNPGTDKETDIQLDYTHPVNDNLTIEAGAKAVLRSIVSNSDVYSLNTNTGNYAYDSVLSNALSYNRKVYAAYLSGTFSLFNYLDVKAGGRFERTITRADYSNAHNVNIPDYNTFAPSITLSHKLEHDQTVKISYTHRIQRPGYRALNPFVNTSDPKNITMGDPTLKPEIGDNVELGYNKSFEKGGTINVALFYKRSAQDIQPYVTYYPSYKVGDSTYYNVSVTTSANIGIEQNTGINLYGSFPITSKLNLRSNLAFFNRYIINTIDAGKNMSSFNYRINLNATYQFNSDLAAEFFGNFNSARNEVQGKYPAFTSYNFAVRQQLWNKKASIALTTTNPFAKYVNQLTEVEGIGFLQSSLREIPFRSFGISFTYKFGKLEFKKPKEDNSLNINPPTE
ncbi:TonB-dependent receptor domain-containing protein [Chitinophagaceae bacterium LWZ2-11]